jgi:hypothetical protein
MRYLSSLHYDQHVDAHDNIGYQPPMERSSTVRFRHREFHLQHGKTLVEGRKFENADLKQIPCVWRLILLKRNLHKCRKNGNIGIEALHYNHTIVSSGINPLCNVLDMVVQVDGPENGSSYKSRIC